MKEKVKCPDCGNYDYPVELTTYEQDDADGNRGTYITFVECSECGTDLKEVIEDEL